MREKFYVVGSFNVLAFDSDKKKKLFFLGLKSI